MEGDYYKNSETVQEYIELAKDVNGKNLIEQLKNHLDLGSRLIELGSGPGTDWNILKQDFDVTGSDNSFEFLTHLKTKYPGNDFLELDASTLQTSLRFKGIYSNKVLHHLKNEELKTSIAGQLAVLENEGIVCHSFWYGQGVEVFKGLYVNYHDEKSLSEAFEPSFKILVLEKYKEFEADDSILLIARKMVH